MLFGKKLASSEKSVRDDAVRELIDYLMENEVADLDLQKLAYGLFYCYWLSDKRNIQADLAEKLAGIILNLPVELAHRYLHAMWTILLREWHKIDYLRLDKYYLLLRKFHFTSFVWMHQNSWNNDIVKRYAKEVLEMILNPNDKLSDGIKLHTAEVVFEESASAVEEKIPLKQSMIILEPLFTLAESTSNSTTLNRILDTFVSNSIPKDDGKKETVFHPLKLFKRLNSCEKKPIPLKNKQAILATCEKLMEILKIDEEKPEPSAAVPTKSLLKVKTEKSKIKKTDKSEKITKSVEKSVSWSPKKSIKLFDKTSKIDTKIKKKAQK